MRFNIISNLTNGVGLQQDYTLLKQALEARGHDVRGVQFNDKPLRISPADINVFLEVVNPLAFKAAPKQWTVPNPEWWFAGWDVHPWDLVLAKTRDCERLFTVKFGQRCQYLGWLSRDLYLPDVKRERMFLHVAGKSRFKNSTAVLKAAQQTKLPLTVIGEHTGMLRRRVPDLELARLMNSHFCHVMPSAYEGYGQVLHEALSCGQVIITTDAPPMHEVQPALLVPSHSTSLHHAGLLHTVTPEAVALAMRQAWSMSAQMVTTYRDDARAQYEAESFAFNKALDQLVGQ